MVNLLKKFENKQIDVLATGKKVDKFTYGDTVKVNVIISEGTTERIQAFEGLCIGRKNKGLRSSFTVRKISTNQGVERTFPLYSPKVESVTVIKKGIVKRAKLYYMRNLKGKATRIAEKINITPK